MGLKGYSELEMMRAQSSVKSLFGKDEDYLSHEELKKANWWRRPVTADITSSFPERPAVIMVAFHEVHTGGYICDRRMTRAELLKTTGLDAAEVRLLLLGHFPDAPAPIASEHVCSTFYRRESCAVSQTLKPEAPPFLKSSGSCLLLRLGDLRGVIDSHCLRLFSAEGTPSRNQQCFLDLLHTRLMQPTPSRPSLFATSAIECALLAISQRLDATVYEARQAIAPLVNAPLVLREVDLERVRQHRSQLQECAAQASAIAAALLAIVAQPLTVLPLVMSDATVEFEAMLEAYLHAYSQCSRECRELLAGIQDFEASTTLALNARRLQIEEFELMLVIGSVALGAGALIPSVFGMNLLNNFESSNLTFRVTVVLTCLVSVTLFWTLRWLAMYRGVFTSHSRMWTQQLFDRSIASVSATFDDPDTAPSGLE
mmetsp:Transcript_48002/g.112046  ORF Transcript_48002/g.112046 Transcript_48002/m.112046 type:complete len:428 (+) Transcript_48002:125-1408(+)